MSSDPDPAASPQSGAYSRSNISEFLGRRSGGLLAAPAEAATTGLDPAQEQDVEDAVAVASSWSVNIKGFELSLRNVYQVVTYPLPSLEQIRYLLDEVHGMDQDDVDEAELFRNPDLSLDGVHKVTDAGDKIDIEGIYAEGVDLHLYSAITQSHGVIEINRLRVARLAYQSPLIDVEASLLLTQIELRATTEKLVSALIAAYQTYSAGADAELGVLDPGEHPGRLKRFGAGLVAALLGNLKVDGISIGGIDVTLNVKKFGMADTAEPAELTSGKSAAGQMVAGFCSELDISIDEIRVEVEADETPLGSAGARLAVKNTTVKVGSDDDGVTVSGGAEINLGGAANVKMGNITGNVAVVALAAVNLQFGIMIADRVQVAVNVKGFHGAAPIALDMTLDMSGVVLGLGTDRGPFVNCLANEALQAIQTSLIYTFGGGGPLGLEPRQAQAQVTAMVVKEVRDAVLKRLKVEFTAEVGHFNAVVNSFAYGAHSGEAVLDVRDVDLDVTLDPDNPVEMNISASVLVSGLLKERDKNLLTFNNIEVDLNEVGDGTVKGHFQLHSTGLSEVLNTVLGSLSKAINKEGDLDLKIKNYAVDLNSTNVQMSSKVLKPLTKLVLSHVGVAGGEKPGLGLVAKVLRKTRIKKIARPDALGQREQEDTAEILIDQTTARAIFENDSSKGAVNLLAFLQNTVQTRLDSLKAWEPDDSEFNPDALPKTPPPSVETVPLSTEEQEKAAVKLVEARRVLANTLQAAKADPDNPAKKAALLDATDARDKAHAGLMAANQDVIDKVMKKILVAAALDVKEANDAARKGKTKNTKKGTMERYVEEVIAAQNLLVNNCLIDAMAAAGGRGAPTIPELVDIRSALNNVGEMMLATPANVSTIRQVLGLTGRRVVVNYPAPIPPEAFNGSEPTIYVRHTGSAHFVADDA